MSYRIQRCEKTIERELADILLNDSHNELLKFVSITKVSLNKDMSVAQIWYTVFGNENEKVATSKALEQAKGFLRSEIAHRIDLRKTPELRFKYDESIEYGKHIEDILNQINNN